MLAAMGLAASVNLFAFSPVSLVTFRTGLNYTMGDDNQTITVNRTLKPFSINKYETTYELWYETRVKAEELLGYKFQNPGQAGSEGKYAAIPSDENANQPVTMINWYDAIVWCNALSELRGRTPCYTYEGRVIRNSNDTATCDLCICDFDSNGYRLPTEAEWEFAARRTKTGFQAGDQISGSTDGALNNSYCWNTENSTGTQTVGTAGTLFVSEFITQPATGNANFAGLYDMSGNVMEFCWDWFDDYDADLPTGPDFGFERVSRGGSWSPYTMFLFNADRYSYDPNECYNYFGFRIVCTAAAK